MTIPDSIFFNDSTQTGNSNPVYSLYISPSTTINAEFKYFFFVKDEKVSPAVYNQQNKSYPRYIKINLKSSWKGPVVKGIVNKSIPPAITENLNNNFVPIELQNFNLLPNIKIQLSGSFLGLAGVVKRSPLPPITPRILNSINNSVINFLTGVSINFSPNNNINLGSLSDLEKQFFSTAINSSYAKSLVNSANFVTNNAFFSGTLKQYENVSPKDKYNILTPYDIPKKIPLGQVPNMEIAFAGFYLDKYSVDDLDNFTFIKSFLIENDFFEDKEVLYGKKYAYRAREIYSMPLITPAPDFGLNFSHYLVAVNSTNFQFVESIINVSPPPPVDLDFIFDYENEGLVLTWNFPTYSIEDIKGFLIFKRFNIDEPYQLIKMYSFNDDVLPLPLPNYLLDPEITEILDNPKITFFDADFNKNGSQIYSIVAYTSHGYYSNLSPQINVTFDVSRNKIKKSLISNLGAPLSYPNLYFKQDLFKDLMFVEGYSRLRVSFDPACRNVSFSNNLPSQKLYVSTKDNSENKYVMTMLNVDNQSFQKMSVSIFDNET